jgi:hypothetical protein
VKDTNVIPFSAKVQIIDFRDTTSSILISRQDPEGSAVSRPLNDVHKSSFTSIELMLTLANPVYEQLPGFDNRWCEFLFQITCIFFQRESSSTYVTRRHAISLLHVYAILLQPKIFNLASVVFSISSQHFQPVIKQSFPMT